MVQSRFAETLTLTLTLNPNFGESVFGESGRHHLYCVGADVKPCSLLNQSNPFILVFRLLIGVCVCVCHRSYGRNFE